MSEDTKNLINELNSAFREFKSTNEERLTSLEAKGSVDVLIEEKTATINDAISAIEAKLTEVEKKAGRPAAAEAADAEAEEHRSMFSEWARKGRNEDELREYEAKNMSVTGDTGNDGGHAVPVIVDTNIRNTLVNLSVIRNLATVITVSTPNHSILRNDKGLASGWVDENDERPETATPKLTKLPITFGELYANPAATQQFLDDAAFDVEGFLSSEIAEAFAVAENAAFFSGNGSNKPTGLYNSSLSSISSAALSSNDLIAMTMNIKPGYRQNGAFIMCKADMLTVRQMKGSDGQYMWQPSLAAGQPSTLAGYACYEDENAVATAEDTASIIFGDLKQYVIADRKGITLLRDPYSNKPYVHFYATKRVGGRVIDPAALVTYKLNAA